MNATRKQIVLAMAILLLTASPCLAQRIDPEIARQIAAIQGVDNHAHPVLAPPLDRSDREFDALPVSSLEPQSDPVALRPDFPRWARHGRLSTVSTLGRHSIKRGSNG